MKRILFAAAMIALATPAIAQAGDSSAPFVAEQAATEWRMNNYIGKPVMNANGEQIGTINDVLFDKSGSISTVAISVGGIMGVGGKLVAVPFSALTYTGANDARVITVPVTAEALKDAPAYTLTEKTTLDKVRDKAGEVAGKAGEKASELKDEAVKKIDEYRKEK